MNTRRSFLLGAFAGSGYGAALIALVASSDNTKHTAAGAADTATPATSATTAPHDAGPSTTNDTTPASTTPDTAAPVTSLDPPPDTVAPTTTAGTPPTTSATSATPIDGLPVDSAALSQPVAPPPPRAAEAKQELGWMNIPKIWPNPLKFYEGITLTTLDRGPGHWPGSSMPGQRGNCVLGGHRTSHGGPFRKIDQLTAGDEIRFATDTGEYSYRVYETFVVQPEEVWIADQVDNTIVTLFACHPIGSTRQRIIVRARLA